jgi:hypothetical protein
MDIASTETLMAAFILALTLQPPILSHWETGVAASVATCEGTLRVLFARRLGYILRSQRKGLERRAKSWQTMGTGAQRT